MKKQSSYQKLKTENQKLMADIRILAMPPKGFKETIKFLDVKALYQIRFSQVDAIMFGKSPIDAVIGILDQVEKAIKPL